MSVIVNDTGFHPALAPETVSLADIASHKGAVDLAQTDAPEALLP
jgi:hypothetical protein